MIIDDISSEIDLIVKNIPNNLEEIEKVRWVYIKLGHLFSYDLGIINDIDNIRNRKVIYEKNSKLAIDRYQSCVQISELLVQILTLPEINVEAKIIDRVINNQKYTDNHKAVAIKLKNDQCYILDLTLDLYLIQSGCQTKNFGFSTDMMENYDIISLNEVQAIDKKLNLVGDKGYFDKEISFKDDIKELQGSNLLKFRIKKINNDFPCRFKGEHEGKLFLNKVFQEALKDVKLISGKAYNLYHSDSNKKVQATTAYIFEFKDEELIYLYNNQIGLLETTPEKVLYMLDTTWHTASNTLVDKLVSISSENKNRNR